MMAAHAERLEKELGLPNPQITVVEVELPEMNPLIMASRVANALERGVHFRRAIFWSLRRIMDSGALGCEIILKGPIRSARSRFERVVEGFVPKAGEPALRYVKKATIHVKMKRGILGVTVHIVPPDAKFPDKVSLDQLPEIEYQQPIPGVEPDEAEATETVEAASETTEPVETTPTETENLKPAAEESLEDSLEESPEEPKEEAAVEPEDVEEPVEPEPEDEDKGPEDEEGEE